MVKHWGMYSALELSYAAQMSLQLAGKHNAAQLFEEASSY
jgi:hypothetical protein